MKYAYPSDIRQFVLHAIETGEYASEDAVVVDAIRALRELRQRQESLRDDVREAIAEIDQGQGEPWNIDEIKSELANQLDAERTST